MKRIIVALSLLSLVGCASTSREVDLKNSCIIMHNVKIFVDKTGVTETPSAKPDLDLTIPFLPGL